MVGSEQVYQSPVSQYGGSKPEVVNKNSEKLERMVYISCSTPARNEILTILPNISVRTLHQCYSNNNKLRVSERKSEIQDGGFENSVAQISAYNTHDSNEIPTATPMFPGSGNTVKLLGILSYAWAC